MGMGWRGHLLARKSNPSDRGMLRSSVTTSGRRSSTCSRASSPSRRDSDHLEERTPRKHFPDDFSDVRRIVYDEHSDHGIQLLSFGA